MAGGVVAGSRMRGCERGGGKPKALDVALAGGEIIGLEPGSPFPTLVKGNMIFLLPGDTDAFLDPPGIGELADDESRENCLGWPSAPVGPGPGPNGGSIAAASNSLRIISGPCAGPGVGRRPSRNAFAISPAFHFAYLILSLCWLKADGAPLSWDVLGLLGLSSNTLRSSRKLAAAKNFLAVPRVASPRLSSLSALSKTRRAKSSI